jgi:hypothetical protein
LELYRIIARSLHPNIWYCHINMKSVEFSNNPRFPPVRFVLIKKAEISMHLSVLKQDPGTFPDLWGPLFGLRDAFFFSI